MSASRKVMRGEVYYVYPFPTTGHEQRSGRPAVIVSSNENNEHSEVYEVCYLTLQDKPKLPTHVSIDRGPCVNSTILCEQITTVAEERLGDFMCRIPEYLEEKLDKALVVSLGLPNDTNSTPTVEDTIQIQHITPTKVLDELNAFKHESVTLKQELDVAKSANETIKEKCADALKRADMYERMYNDLLDRLMKRA